MGLKEIREAGEMAILLTDAANNMSTIKNTHQARYDELLASVQASLGVGQTLSTLTDAEINSFFFGGLGDTVAIENAQTILVECERNMIQLVASVDLLPINDI